MRRLGRLRHGLRPPTLQSLGVGAVIAVVHLDLLDAIALSHRPAQRGLELAPMPATGARRDTDEEMDQLVEERLLGVAPSLSGESGHGDPPLVRDRESEPRFRPPRGPANAEGGTPSRQRPAVSSENGKRGQPAHLRPEVYAGHPVIAGRPPLDRFPRFPTIARASHCDSNVPGRAGSLKPWRYDEAGAGAGPASSARHSRSISRIICG